MVRARLLSLALAGLAVGTACTTAETGLDDGTTYYALVEGIEGVYFHPPLGPAPSATGTFDATLADGLAVTIEATAPDGAVTTIARFDAATQPGVRLLGTHERYAVNVPAGAYITDPSMTYRVIASLDGAELGASTLSSRIFDFLATNPALTMGVQLRIEGAAVRAAAPARRGVGGSGTPLHCSDGVMNKDETGVDCGGGCVACATCDDGLQNQGEEQVDCGGPCAACPTCSDGVQNQGEEQADCGGPCAPCATCSDGVRNQGEAGVDCGGPCAACPTCSDGIRNQGEGGVDCGGPCGTACRCAGTFTYWVWVYGGQQQYARTFRGYRGDTHYTSPIPDADCWSRFRIPNIMAIHDQSGRIVDGQYACNCANDTPRLTLTSFTPDDPTCN
ncbi:hypothetical protein L6R52_22610 [Myxococcota bacterium]|nr:hypothetical protein [Myxococcota bacterium]